MYFFMIMCMNVAKEHIKKYTYLFDIFAHRFFNHVPYMKYGTGCNLNKYSNLVQLWYVMISMMSFSFLLYEKIQHIIKSWSRASEARLAIHVSLRTSPDEG